MSDEGFHEIQLNGKQLVFLFMAATVVSVVIFLCGVMVGRGVRGQRPALEAAVEASSDPTSLAAPALAPAPAAAVTSNAPVAAQETLTYLATLTQEQLAGLTGERLLEVRSVHDEQHTVLWCVYHLVEHFGMHTGQILSMAKAVVPEFKPVES